MFPLSLPIHLVQGALYIMYATLAAKVHLGTSDLVGKTGKRKQKRKGDPVGDESGC
jgi:hypothetical protein